MQTSGKFVIQKHTRAGEPRPSEGLGEVHWDLMLEAGSVLETYRLCLPPIKLMREKTAATKIFEHPLRFLTYEGSVNQGAGNVEIADRGTYYVFRQKPDYVELELAGKILQGCFVLRCLGDDKWQFSPAIDTPPPPEETSNFPMPD